MRVVNEPNCDNIELKVMGKISGTELNDHPGARVERFARGRRLDHEAVDPVPVSGGHVAPEAPQQLGLEGAGGAVKPRAGGRRVVL